MPDDDVQDDPDGQADESTSSDESTSETDESADDRDAETDTDDSDGDGESDEDSDGTDESDEDDEHEKLVKGYMAGGKTRKEALKLLATSHKESTKRASDLTAELERIKAGKAEDAEPEEKAKPADPNLALPVEKHPDVLKIGEQLNTLKAEFAETKTEIAGIQGDIKKLDTEAKQLEGELRRAEDHEKASLEAKIERIKAEVERKEARVERLNDTQQRRSEKFDTLKTEKLPAVIENIKQAKANAKRADEDMAKAVKSFGRQWDSASKDVMDRHGVPVDKEHRAWVDQFLNAFAQAEIKKNGGIDDLDEFFDRNIKRAVREMKKFAGVAVGKVSKDAAAKDRRLSAGPKGEAAKTTSRTPPSSKEKTWADYQRDARKAGL